ncbi:MAG TPA: hypothetical protein VF469_07025 [Kofleriaceae bacterium]
MRPLLLLLGSPWLVAVLAWTALAACLDTPVAGGPSLARLVVAWDPLACGEPHRVVIELADETGAPLSASAPCNLGGLTVDVSHFGSYHGRLYAWALDAPVRSVMPVELVIDQPITHWDVATPP